MAEELFIKATATKSEKYESLLPQLAALIAGESDLTANLANISAALKETFGWWWVGFYWVKNEELVLAPFQGPIACTRIKYGKGVCGTAWKTATSQFVPDVEKFPGHIACNSSSVSEIVVPIFDKQGDVAGVLDVDSERYDVLDETDVIYLEKISKLITDNLGIKSPLEFI
jgi:GAF domain-containing protein